MRIGVDLGGTKIEAIALEDDGQILIRQRVATPTGDYTGTVEAIAGLVFDIEAKLGIKCVVGVGTPGTVSGKTGLMINCNSTILNGKPLPGDLEQALSRPIRIENDANCLALSEAIDGAAAGAQIVFAIILGTGVGGGLVVDRRLRSGPNHITGEWGHNPLPWMTETEWPGPLCWCGKHGCIETFLNGAALAEAHFLNTSRRTDAAEIADQAEAGDHGAITTLTIYRNRLARGLAHLINILDPDTIVLGGGLSNIKAIYDGLIPQIKTSVFSDSIRTEIVRAQHGDSSGVRGAARLNEHVARTGKDAAPEYEPGHDAQE